MANNLNIPISEFSSPIIASASLEMSIKEIMMLLEKNGFRHLPVVEDDKPVGIISARDLKIIKALNDDSSLKAKDIMIEDPFCVSSEVSMEDAAFEMSKRKIGSALVVDENGKLDSIFTSIDGLNALVEILRGDFNK